MIKPYKIFLALVLAFSPLLAAAADVNFELQVSPASGSGQTGGSGGAGGSSFVPNAPSAVTEISGWTSPLAYVEAIVGNQTIASALSKADGSFTVKSILDGTRTTYLRSTDVQGNLSGLSQPIKLVAGSNAAITGIVLPPTLAFSSSDFPQTSPVEISGRSIPNNTASVTLTFSDGTSQTQLVSSGSDGKFSANFPAKALPAGPVLIQVAVNFAGQNTNTLASGKIVVSAKQPASCALADLNCDGKINLQDISILLSNFGKQKFPDRDDLNKDGKINLVDFSIMLYHFNKPIKIALLADEGGEGTVDIQPPTIYLDVGKSEDDKWIAAFSASDSQTDVSQTEISVDGGKNWRPAESPYLLGADRPAQVLARAYDQAGNVGLATFSSGPNNWARILAALVGIFCALAIIVFSTLNSRKHA